MPDVNSRSQTVGRASKSRYITSESGVDTWGQPPASHYRFRLVGVRMFGTPVVVELVTQSTPRKDSSEAELNSELAIWDSLSDEALLAFEDSMD